MSETSEIKVADYVHAKMRKRVAAFIARGKQHSWAEGMGMLKRLTKMRGVSQPRRGKRSFQGA